MLRVSLYVDDKVMSGQVFGIALRVSLAEERKNQAEELVKIVDQHHDWYTFVDVRQQIVEDGMCGEGTFYRQITYHNNPDLFRGHGLIIPGTLRAPHNPQDSYELTARVRIDGVRSSWTFPYVDKKIIQVG